MCVLFQETATTEIYTYRHTLARHDALPIFHHHTIIGGSRTMVNTSTARRVIFKHRSIPTWSVAARKSADPGHGTTELPANPDLTFANSAEWGERRRRL